MAPLFLTQDQDSESWTGIEDQYCGLGIRTTILCNGDRKLKAIPSGMSLLFEELVVVENKQLFFRGGQQTRVCVV